MVESAEIVRDRGRLAARIALLYVRGLFVIEVALFTLSVALHVIVLTGAEKPFANYGKPLLYFAFAVVIPVLGLAQERNVWKREFRDCPRWLRITTLVFMIYGGTVASVQVMFFSEGVALESQPLLATAASLFFESVPLCIPYSLLWANPMKGLELAKRVRVSLIAFAICTALFVAARSGFLPHPAR